MTITSRLRVIRFSLVGAMGIAVQLGVLAALIAMKMNYLLATGLAVEAAVLHNFLWHQRVTWPDWASRGVPAVLAQLLRFHLSNGLISIIGNLLLMRLLVDRLGVEVFVANLVTISLCFAANYLASDRWVFLSEHPLPHQQQGPLGEGKIDQRGSRREGQADPDLRSQQKRRERPELIEYKDSREQTKKFSTETGKVKGHSREQVQTNWNANRGRPDQDGGDPCRVPEDVLQQLFDYAQPGQCADVEAEVQNLYEQKKYADISMRDRGQIFGTSKQ